MADYQKFEKAFSKRSGTTREVARNGRFSLIGLDFLPGVWKWFQDRLFGVQISHFPEPKTQPKNSPRNGMKTEPKLKKNLNVFEFFVRLHLESPTGSARSVPH